MKALLAISVLLAGCATRPMTEEEQERSDRMIQALQILNNQYNRPRAVQSLPAPPPSSQPLAVLKGSYVSGANRICIYNRAGADFVTTQTVTLPCPPSQ